MEIEAKITESALETKVSWKLTKEELESLRERKEVPVLVLCSAQFTDIKVRISPLTEWNRTMLSQNDYKVVLASEGSATIAFFDPGEGYLFCALFGVKNKVKLKELEWDISHATSLIRPGVGCGPTCDDDDCGSGPTSWARGVFGLSSKYSLFSPIAIGGYRESLGIAHKVVQVPPEACFIPWDDRFIRWAIGGRSKGTVHHWVRRLMAYPTAILKGFLFGIGRVIRWAFWPGICFAFGSVVVVGFVNKPLETFAYIVSIGFALIVLLVIVRNSERITGWLSEQSSNNQAAKTQNWLERQFEKLLGEDHCG